MAALNWTDALALQQPLMDDTHREFIELLEAVEAAVAQPDVAAVGASLARFVAHTERHFAQEDDWMARIGFAPTNCHARQHAQVLQLLHEVQRRLHDGSGGIAADQVGLVGQLVPALAEWFVPHARNMDGGLAQVMVATGFDPVTGSMTNPPDAPGDAAFEPPLDPTLTAAATPT